MGGAGGRACGRACSARSGAERVTAVRLRVGLGSGSRGSALGGAFDAAAISDRSQLRLEATGRTPSPAGAAACDAAGVPLVFACAGDAVLLGASRGNKDGWAGGRAAGGPGRFRSPGRRFRRLLAARGLGAAGRGAEVSGTGSAVTWRAEVGTTGLPATAARRRGASEPEAAGTPEGEAAADATSADAGSVD